MKLRKQISEAKSINIYKTLLNLFAEFCDRFPASSVDRLFDILVEAGTKILPTDKRALDIISYAIAYPIGDGQTSEVQTFLNLRFGELPTTLRPITKEGKRHELVFWCRDGKVYDKVRDLVNFSQEKGKGFWGDVDCKKVTLLDMIPTNEAKKKIKEDEEEPEDTDDDRSPARKYVDKYFMDQKDFSGDSATYPKRLQTTAKIIKNLFKLDGDTAIALFKNVAKGQGVDVGEALVNIDQPAVKDEKPAEDEVAADNLLEPVDFKKKAKSGDREPGVEDVKDKDLKQLLDGADTFALSKFIQRKVTEQQLVELHDLLPELGGEVLSDEEKDILHAAFEDKKIDDMTPAVSDMVMALVKVGAFDEKAAKQVLDYSSQEGEDTVKAEVAELYLKHVLLPLIRSDVDVEEAVTTEQKSITAVMQNAKLTDSQKSIISSAIENGVIADKLPDMQHIKDALISAAFSKQEDYKSEQSSDVLRRSLVGQVTEEEIIKTWLQEYLLPVLTAELQPKEEEEDYIYRECVECTKVFKANAPKCLYCNSENTKPIAEGEESPESNFPPGEYQLLLVVEEELNAQQEGISDEYDFAFVDGVDEGENVLNWVKENEPETFEKWLANPEDVSGDDVLWDAMEALDLVKEKESHYDSTEDEAGNDRWLKRHGSPSGSIVKGDSTVEANLAEMKEYCAITENEKKALSIVRMLTADGLEGVYVNRVQDRYEIYFGSTERELIKDTIADLEKMKGVHAPVIEEIEESVNEAELTVPQKHQLKIARDTLKMTDAGSKVMGGPNKEEARAIIKKLTGKVVKEEADDDQGAHYQGYNDGLDGEENKYPNPINAYQKEYARGYKSGSLLKTDKTNEETDSDNYSAIARGLKDEKDAQEIARNKKGRVVQDDEDEKAFMVISKTDESVDTKDWLVFYKDAKNPHLDEIAINKTFAAISEDDACKQAQDLLDREAPGSGYEIVRANVNESLQTRLLKEAKKDARRYFA